MKNLNVYIQEKMKDMVYAVVDDTGAILDIFNSEEDAHKAADELPKEANAKVKPIERSEICNK